MATKPQTDQNTGFAGINPGKCLVEALEEDDELFASLPYSQDNALECSKLICLLCAYREADDTDGQYTVLGDCFSEANVN